MRIRPACMAARISRSERTAIAADYRGARSAAPGESFAAGAATGRSAGLGLNLDLFALGEQRVDFLAQVLEALVTLVHAGKSDVGDLVELAQLVHGHLANQARRDLGRAAGG